MMRMYGRIQNTHWNNLKNKALSDTTKLLTNYLLTNLHTNMLGCFFLPFGYISEDLEWVSKKVTKEIQQLCEIGFISQDSATGWILIYDFLKWNPIENPNQGKAIEKLFLQVPKEVSFYPELIAILIQHHQYLSPSFRDHLETVLKGFRNQEQEQEQKQDQKQNISMSGKPDVDSLENPFLGKESNYLKSQHQQIHRDALEILAFLNEKTGRVYRPVPANLKLITARLKSGATLVECRQVIAKKTREWKGDPKMVEYLRPATLFNSTKFEQYVGELVLPKRHPNEND